MTVTTFRRTWGRWEFTAWDDGNLRVVCAATEDTLKRDKLHVHDE